jgi:hypothetical protein
VWNDVRVSAPRRDYREDDFAARLAWVASRGEPLAAREADIRARARCSPTTALHVWLLQRAACPVLVVLWLDRALTLRQALRIALAVPFDEEAQRAEASATSPTARALLQRQDT